MALNIKDRDTEEVVRRLAQRTGLSITEAVKQAAADKLRRMDADYADEVARMTPEQLANLRKLEEIGRRGAARSLLDTRTDDEILGYDDKGTFE